VDKCKPLVHGHGGGGGPGIEVGWCRFNHVETSVETAWFHCFKLEYGDKLSKFAFKFNVRRYIEALEAAINGVAAGSASASSAAAAAGGGSSGIGSLPLNGLGVSAGPAEVRAAVEAGAYTRPRFSST